MLVDDTKCKGCGICVDYCPVEAIYSFDKKTFVDRDKCVECGVCLRDANCPTGAIFEEELEWPRIIRKIFSDPTLIKKDTKVTGRGTEEMKTNDVTGRFKKGHVGIGIELGRPSVGASFSDVQAVTESLVQRGVKLEQKNPLSKLINPIDGKVDQSILNERVLSAIVEFVIPVEEMESVITKITNISDGLETVFSLDVIIYNDESTKSQVINIINRLNIPISSAGKTNVGLGRPLKEIT